MIAQVETSGPLAKLTLCTTSSLLSLLNCSEYMSFISASVTPREESKQEVALGEEDDDTDEVAEAVTCRLDTTKAGSTMDTEMPN